MQTLGLSDSTPRTESRWRALFWPTIRNDADYEYVTVQGFWVCTVVSALSLVTSALGGSLLLGTFEGGFFFLAGVGVRQRSKAAAVTAFLAYLLSALVMQRYTGSGFGIVRVIFLALLLANIRGNWLSAKWPADPSPPIRLNQTIGDKISDQLPMFLWSKVKIVFYVFAAIEIMMLLWALLAPRP
jgi:hypothetical protein